ncbi:MAG: dipeptidase PepE [Lentimicrobiaceae bacterium]|nr:dipeptidase PepE [Lentimicrobiaceae bacterium]MCB9024345.1 dipeptidase PepE [Lentimicrobiaceae bacterium]MCO5264690.1 dipeptidase PepE [Lentimicrobium sp.]HPG32584.1 dipeptidase PepE [Lentimicrobium sp.]
MKLLLISNSTNPGEEYLGWPRNDIKNFLNNTGVKRVLFIPYAGVTMSYDAYEAKVKAVFELLGYQLYSIHHETDPVLAVAQAEAIAVGGGNTFHLVREMQRTGIMQAIRGRVKAGVPYMGWSAGSNVACPSLRTTNDMPIVQPDSFDCMGLIPFQINPHYLDAHPTGHGGETREQRIEEFLAANQHMYVAGLREATSLVYEDGHLKLIGKHPMRVFRYGIAPREIEPGSDVDFLMF